MANTIHPGLRAGEQDTAIPRDAEHDRERHLPGDGSIWLFVIGEMVTFSCYFAAYMFDHRQLHELFLQSQRFLNPNIGAFNTLLLLASSWFVALGVQAMRAGDSDVAARFVGLGAACGAGFVCIKGVEWHAELAKGLTLGTNKFFMHYYMLTGVHLFHVLLGLVFLGILWRELNGPNSPRVRLVETGATYWHMVDFLWIIIFPLLYLLR